MQPESETIKFKIAASRRILARNGCESAVAGHVSARSSEGNAFWVSPFEYFDETLPNRLIEVDTNLNLLHGDWEPSPAIHFHAGIYNARADVNSVIHIHSHYLSVFATTRRTVGMFNARSALFYDDQALYEGPVDVERIVKQLGSRRILLMKNHGAIIASQSLENATVEAFTLEEAARFHIEAEAIGGTELPHEVALRGRAQYQKYYLPNMWEANLRRLRRSDPDLMCQDPTSTPVVPTY
jgi:L-fuculose-phosphate aldolase